MAESAEAAGEFASILSELTDLLQSVEDELEFLSNEFQVLLDAADKEHQALMDRWLQDPPGM